ncbi:hypothetical protein ABZ467_33560 [Streptomyces sp. NPDC005727]|uniref:hypothetical protein n=1 Tax=Streptomyces sp. NPDC005727 TaxID=3157053 RepID=UPI0033FF3D8B
MVTSNESPNDALTTKSLLSGACRSATPGEALTLPGFMELTAFCEAVVILDSVRVISSTDGFTHPLTDLLTAEGVLTEFKPALKRPDATRLLSRLPIDLKERLPTDIGVEHLTDPSLLADTDFVPPNATGMLDSSLSPPEADLDAAILARWVESLPNYPSLVAQGAPSRDRAYRAVGYLLVATAQGLDYFPDADRSPFVGSVLSRLYTSLPRAVYERVAKAWNTEGDEEAGVIPEWDMQVQVPIPPVAARVLDGCRSLSDLGPQLLELRNEFVGYRRHFREFKSELQNAPTFRQRKEARQKYQQRLEQACGPDKEVISVQEVLNFGEQLTKAAAAPMAPTSYSAALLTQPIEWIRRWWSRRPLTVLFRMDGKVPNLSTYGELIGKLWGHDVHDGLLDEYVRQARRVERLALASTASTDDAG